MILVKFYLHLGVMLTASWVAATTPPDNPGQYWIAAIASIIALTLAGKTAEREFDK